MQGNGLGWVVFGAIAVCAKWTVQDEAGEAETARVGGCVGAGDKARVVGAEARGVALGSMLGVASGEHGMLVCAGGRC
jgi:hypothetical protein